MIVLAGEWIESEYITKDENGIHCSKDAPEEIKKAYEDYMNEIGDGGVLISIEEPK